MTQRKGVGDRLVAAEDDFLQLVAFAFFHRHGDIDHFALTTLPRHVPPDAADIADLRLRVGHDRLEVTLGLVFVADAFRVFLQFGGIEGLGEEGLEENGVWNADRPQVFHRRTQFAWLEILIAFENDPADFDLGTFFHYEGHRYGCRRNRMDFGTDRRELPAVGGEQFLNDDFGFLNPGRIVLALLGEPDLAFLELIEDVAL